jgi:hypothetical protein
MTGMADEVPGTPSGGRGRSPAAQCANIGLVVGLVLGLVLALLEISVAVPFESDEGQRPRYRLVVLGFTVFRYPEDGALFAMRPWPQARAARELSVWASTIAGGIVGWMTGYAYGLLRRRRNLPEIHDNRHGSP